jgi:hypothetical protein
VLLLAVGCHGVVEEPGQGRGRPAESPRTSSPAGDRPATGTPSGANPNGAPGASPGSPAAAGGPGACAPIPPRIWKLTPAQYRNTLRQLVPAAADAIEDLSPTLAQEGQGWNNKADRLDLTAPHVTVLFDNASLVARSALAAPAALAPCLAGGFADRACVKDFLVGFGARAFRRPLQSEEVNEYLTAYDREAAVHGRRGRCRG